MPYRTAAEGRTVRIRVEMTTAEVRRAIIEWFEQNSSSQPNATLVHEFADSISVGSSHPNAQPDAAFYVFEWEEEVPK